MATFYLGETRGNPSMSVLSPRPLAEFLVGNIPLRQHQLMVLSAACLIPGAETKHDILVDGAAWLELADVLAFLAADQAQALTTPLGQVLLTRSSGHGPAVVSGRSFHLSHPWELLTANERVLAAKLEYTRAAEYHPSLYVDGRLQVGPGTKILPGVVIEGDVIIGADCKIGPNCYIRGATSVGDGCHVGQAVELKNSLLMTGTNVGHLSYVGDSVLGMKVNLGAGTVTSNLRHDGKNHRSMVGGVLIDTGRRKFGAIIGDNVHTGIHTSIYPGRKIGPGATTRPGAIVERDILS
jgi:bifunctional UDP-N-acetylglucosamine pyrophosphorylase/glucosamine-1-phosphate N-acetyltransferase